jgi:hypothetical protein
MKLQEKHESHIEMMDKKSEMREEMKEKRAEFREKRSGTIMKYKTAFADKLGSRLDKIPSDKLEKVSNKLSEMYDKTEANEKISEESKELLLSKITALQDVIDARLEEDEIDVESLLDIVE